MKKRTKLVALLMGMVLAMGSMTACGGGSDSANNTSNNDSSNTGDTQQATGEKKDVSLTVWVPQEELSTEYEGKGLTEYMVEQFNASQEQFNVTAEIKPCGEDQAYSELSKDATAGADVFMFASDQLGSMVSDKIILPLAGTEDMVANNSEKAVETITVDGQVYGVPFTPNTWFMYYDKSKYTEDEVKSLDTMMAKDIDGTPYNFSLTAGNGWYNGSFFYTNGCTVFGEDGSQLEECNFNDKNGLAAGEAMLNLVTNKKFLLEDGKGVALANLEKGKLAAMCSGTWDAAAVKEALGDNYAAAKVPTIKIGGEEKQLLTCGGYKCIGVNASSKEPAAAQALALYLGGEQAQTDRYTSRGITPTWKSVTETDDVKADVASLALLAQIENSYGTPSDPKFSSNFWTPMEALGNGMVNGSVTKDNLQKELDSVVENITKDLAN